MLNRPPSEKHARIVLSIGPLSASCGRSCALAVKERTNTRKTDCLILKHQSLWHQHVSA